MKINFSVSLEKYIDQAKLGPHFHIVTLSLNRWWELCRAATEVGCVLFTLSLVPDAFHFGTPESLVLLKCWDKQCEMVSFVHMPLHYKVVEHLLININIYASLET